MWKPRASDQAAVWPAGCERAGKNVVQLKNILYFTGKFNFRDKNKNEGSTF